MDRATQLLNLIAFGLQLWDEVTREEQSRTGKTAAELLDSGLARVNANEELGAQLKEKFSVLQTTPE